MGYKYALEYVQYARNYDLKKNLAFPLLVAAKIQQFLSLGLEILAHLLPPC